METLQKSFYVTLNGDNLSGCSTFDTLIKQIYLQIN
jgi:hypothetical protein